MSKEKAEMDKRVVELQRWREEFERLANESHKETEKKCPKISKEEDK